MEIKRGTPLSIVDYQFPETSEIDLSSSDYVGPVAYKTKCYFQFWATISRLIEVKEGWYNVSSVVAVVVMEDGKLKEVPTDQLEMELIE